MTLGPEDSEHTNLIPAVEFAQAPVMEVWLAGQPIQVVRVLRAVGGAWLVAPDNPDRQDELRWLTEAEGYTVQ